ncbi:MAG: NTP transferase domain-containing protein [Vicinamibacterales bacterium]
MATEQTVILAAGLGSRLGSAEAGIPKPLMEVAGLPLVAHAVAHAEASGCRDAVVVVGYEGDRVRRAVQGLRTSLDIRFVETPDPTAPNGHSLLAAAPFARERFFLQMVDHVFGRCVLPVLDRGRPHPGEAGRLLVDPAPGADLDLDDATKVQLDGSRIVAIGKGLASWDAIDTGCFVLTPRVFEALRSVPSSEPRTVSSAMRRLVAWEAFFAAPLKGVPWADVDTPADRDVAERLLDSASALRGS